MHKSQNHGRCSGASTLLLVLFVDLLFSVFTAAGKSYEPISFVLGKADDWNLRESALISPRSHLYIPLSYIFACSTYISTPCARQSCRSHEEVKRQNSQNAKPPLLHLSTKAHQEKRRGHRVQLVRHRSLSSTSSAGLLCLGKERKR